MVDAKLFNKDLYHGIVAEILDRDSCGGDQGA